MYFSSHTELLVGHMRQRLIATTAEYVEEAVLCPAIVQRQDEGSCLCLEESEQHGTENFKQ